MKKIFTFFAAMLVAIAVSADPVALPAVLDVSNVSFRSEGMPDFVLTEGDYAGTYFDMGAHDSANDTLLYAEWDVTIEPINYYVAVDVYNTNSWRVQLYVLNQAGDTVKSLRYKGSSGQCGQFAIGAIDMRDLAAGDYKVRAHAATAWSAMKLKDVIFTADYSGVNVALPGTLQPAYAELSANASITNNAIAFKPSTAPDEYANWNVSFAEAGTYNVTIDITASNGHNYGVELIGEDEETSYGAVDEGGQVGDTGEKELGAITVPAAGKYIVHLTNSIQWSEAVLNSITFAGEAAPAEPLTFYLKLSDDWAGWPARYAIYTWKDGVGDLWVPMEAVEGETNMYTASIPADNDHLIFVRLNGETTGYNWDEKWSQTIDLDFPAEGLNLFTVTSGGTGSECNGSWSTYEPAAPVPAEAQLWKVTAETPAAANSILIDDDLLQLASVYTSYISGTNHTFGEEVFAKSFQVRAKNAPSEQYPAGEENAATDDNKKASPLILTAKKNIEVTFYYRQQQTAESPAAENDNKDLWIFDQAAITTKLTGTHTSVDVSSDSKYAFVTKKMTFEQGHVYTLTAVGTTLPLFGLEYQAAGEIPTDIVNTKVSEKAIKMIENGQLIILKNGVRYNVMGAVLR